MALQAGGGMLARCGRCDPHILNSPWNLPDKKCYYSDLYPYSSGGKKDLEKHFSLLLLTAMHSRP